MNEGLLTADDLAVRLKVRPATILRWAVDGSIPSIKFNDRVIRFDYAAVCEAVRRGGRRAGRSVRGRAASHGG